MKTSCVVALAVCTIFASAEASGQAIPIGIIDYYGLNGLSVDRVRTALTFKEGDTISLENDVPPAFIAASEARLKTLPEVQRARINLVCCESGQAMVYVGVERRGSKMISFRPAPNGNAHLAPDVVQAGDEFSKAFTLAVQRGDALEDRSQGHALNHDPATRAAQDRFIIYAKRDLPTLRNVLRTSSNAAQRALAVQVLGYAENKTAIVDDLVYAMGDPSSEVRNSAMRALLVISEMTATAQRTVPSIPAAPFIELLNSLVWSDRNKASGALDALTRHRDAHPLEALRREAISPLADIARWKSEGHALPGFLVLARIAGYSDEVALDLWKRGQRETVIIAALRDKW